jgi:hypothetical protein
MATGELIRARNRDRQAEVLQGEIRGGARRTDLRAPDSSWPRGRHQLQVRRQDGQHAGLAPADPAGEVKVAGARDAHRRGALRRVLRAGG